MSKETQSNAPVLPLPENGSHLPEDASPVLVSMTPEQFEQAFQPIVIAPIPASSNGNGHHKEHHKAAEAEVSKPAVFTPDAKVEKVDPASVVQPGLWEGPGSRAEQLAQEHSSAAARFDSMLRPENILDLKDRYDRAVRRMSEERHPNYDQRSAVTKQGELQHDIARLKQQLIESYVQTGVAKGEQRRNVPATIREEISHSLDQSMRDLEDRMHDGSTEESQRRAQVVARAAQEVTHYDGSSLVGDANNPNIVSPSAQAAHLEELMVKRQQVQARVTARRDEQSASRARYNPDQDVSILEEMAGHKKGQKTESAVQSSDSQVSPEEVVNNPLVARAREQFEDHAQAMQGVHNDLEEAELIHQQTQDFIRAHEGSDEDGEASSSVVSEVVPPVSSDIAVEEQELQATHSAKSEPEMPDWLKQLGDEQADEEDDDDQEIDLDFDSDIDSADLQQPVTGRVLRRNNQDLASVSLPSAPSSLVVPQQNQGHTGPLQSAQVSAAPPLLVPLARPQRRHNIWQRGADAIGRAIHGAPMPEAGNYDVAANNPNIDPASPNAAEALLGLARDQLIEINARQRSEHHGNVRPNWLQHPRMGRLLNSIGNRLQRNDVAADQEAHFAEEEYRARLDAFIAQNPLHGASWHSEVTFRYNELIDIENAIISRQAELVDPTSLRAAQGRNILAQQMNDETNRGRAVRLGMVAVTAAVGFGAGWLENVVSGGAGSNVIMPAVASVVGYQAGARMAEDANRLEVRTNRRRILDRSERQIEQVEQFNNNLQHEQDGDVPNITSNIAEVRRQAIETNKNRRNASARTGAAVFGGAVAAGEIGHTVAYDLGHQTTAHANNGSTNINVQQQKPQTPQPTKGSEVSSGVTSGPKNDGGYPANIGAQLNPQQPMVPVQRTVDILNLDGSNVQRLFPDLAGHHFGIAEINGYQQVTMDGHQLSPALQKLFDAAELTFGK